MSSGVSNILNLSYLSDDSEPVDNSRSDWEAYLKNWFETTDFPADPEVWQECLDTGREFAADYLSRIIGFQVLPEELSGLDASKNQDLLLKALNETAEKVPSYKIENGESDNNHKMFRYTIEVEGGTLEVSDYTNGWTVCFLSGEQTDYSPEPYGFGWKAPESFVVLNLGNIFPMYEQSGIPLKTAKQKKINDRIIAVIVAVIFLIAIVYSVSRTQWILAGGYIAIGIFVLSLFKDKGEIEKAEEFESNITRIKEPQTV